MLTRVYNKQVAIGCAALVATVEIDIGACGRDGGSVHETWERVGAKDAALGPEELRSGQHIIGGTWWGKLSLEWRGWATVAGVAHR